MATKIRLKRIGRRNRPFYRIIIIDSRKRRDGSAIEQVGWYNPIESNKEKNYILKEDRILEWLKLGAQVTDPVNKLMKRSGLAYRWHLMKQGLSEKEIEKILGQIKDGVVQPKSGVEYNVGEKVQVIDGPFASFSGLVEDIDEDKSRLKVSVSIFGLLVFVFVKNYIRSKIQYYLEKNQKNKKEN